MVLTRLSVAAATSVYTPRAVEIEPFYSRDRAAFVCGHVTTIADVKEAVDGYRQLLRHRLENGDEDRDAEIVLAIWNSTLDIAQVAALAESFTQEWSEGVLPLFGFSTSASLSYRTTGVSPTQTGTSTGSHIWLIS